MFYNLKWFKKDLDETTQPLIDRLITTVESTGNYYWDSYLLRIEFSYYFEGQSAIHSDVVKSEQTMTGILIFNSDLFISIIIVHLIRIIIWQFKW